MQQAELVAVRVAQIGQIQAAGAGLATPARRVFAGHAASGHAGGMGRIGLRGRLGRETEGAAVANAGRRAVDGRGDAKGVARVAPEGAVLGVGESRLAAEGAEQGIVELLGFVEVAGSQHDVAEHRLDLRVWV